MAFPSRQPRVWLAVAALLYSIVTLVVRALPLPNIVALLIAVGSPFVPLIALAGLAVSVLRRRILLSLIAIAVVAATLAVQLSWYYSGRPAEAGQHVDVRVLSSNLRKGRADPSVFVELAKKSADVITVSELTPEAVQRFSQAGIGQEFPYSVLIPAPAAGGIGLWSRYPLVAESTPQKRNSIAAARLRIPGVRFDPLVVSVHITSPVVLSQIFGPWKSGIATTRGALDVLTRNAAAASIKTVTLPGSDHRSLIATVHVPMDPTAS